MDQEFDKIMRLAIAERINKGIFSADRKRRARIAPTLRRKKTPVTVRNTLKEQEKEPLPLVCIKRKGKSVNGSFSLLASRFPGFWNS